MPTAHLLAHRGSVMSRVLALAPIALVVIGCATSTGTFTKSPYTFPSQATLREVAVKPAPEKLYSQQVAAVESWTVESTRAHASQAPFAGELPFAQEVSAALEARAPQVTVSDALVCVAQETARFRASTSAAPSEAIEEFISARCGSSYTSTAG